MQWQLALLSKGEPETVSKWSEAFPQARWYVGEGERDTYKQAGAKYVEEAGWCEARNLAVRSCTKTYIVIASADVGRFYEMTADP